MDVLFLARLQFAITTIFHFFFVPLSIGLSIFIAVLEGKYVRTGDENMKKMVKFFGKLFLINFAMGVASGIVQEFQFGMNWSSYARYVGDIFGAPLAVEALLAFFIESTFLGLWVFGWDKLSKKTHLLCIRLVAAATTISAYWILTANSFMQAPVGYTINTATGRAELIDVFALLTNGHTFYQFTHVIAASLTLAGFFALGVCAYQILHNRHEELFNKIFKTAASFAFIGTIAVVLIGHFQGQYAVKHQPMKMAASEAHWNTSDAPDLALIAIPNKEAGENSFSIAIPGMLSFLSYNRFGQQVPGINDLQAEMEAAHGPGDYIPPITLTFYSFRIMFGVGFLMLLISFLAFLWSRKENVSDRKKFLQWLIPCIALPYICCSTGWIMAEVGRQPWIVYELQTLAEGISKVVPATAVLFTLVGFTVIYTVLTGIAFLLMVKHGKRGLDEAPAQEVEGGNTLWI